MPKIWLIGGAALLAALLLASVVVALMEREEVFPKGTPESAVQRYLIAAEEEDFKTAHSLLSAELRGECSVEQLAGTPFGRYRDLADSRVTLEDTIYLNGAAVVVVRVTRISGSGPFGTYESQHEQRYSISQEDGEWRFTEYPWLHYDCARPPPVEVDRAPPVEVDRAPPVEVDRAPPPPEHTPTPEPVPEATPSS